MLESMIGVFIAGMIFVTFLGILPKMIVSEKMAKQTIIATNLAQEGIEKVRNLRDNNLKNNCAAFTVSGGPCNFPANKPSPGYEEGSSLLPNADKLDGYTRTIIIAASGTGGTNRTVTSRVTITSVNKTVEIIDDLSSWGQAE